MPDQTVLRVITGATPRPLIDKQDLPKTYPKGRRCTMPGCTTQLSIYNGSEVCNPCQPRWRRINRYTELRKAA